MPALFIQQALTFDSKTSLDHHHINYLGLPVRSRLHKQSLDQPQPFHLSQAMYCVLKLAEPFCIWREGFVDDYAIRDLFE